MLSNPPFENNSDDNIMIHTAGRTGLHFIGKNCELHQLFWSFIGQDVWEKFYDICHFHLFAELYGTCLCVKGVILQ